MKQQTFTLQNMQTYFKSYIPCSQHMKQPITNFCTERICLRFLCPECVQIHSHQYANHPIQSMKTIIKKTSQRLNQTITELENQTNNHAFLKSKNANQYVNELLKQLQQVKKSLLAQIHAYFRQKQIEIKKQAQKGNLLRNRMDNIRGQLLQAIKQLKLLNNNLFNTNQTSNAIKKANAIDYRTMLLHFKKQIHSLQNQLKSDVRLQMDQQKREILRNSLNSLIGVKNLHKGAYRSPGKYQKQLNQFHINQEDIHYQTKSQHMFKAPPISGDRHGSQASFRIDFPNYFVGQPFLHFFQISKSHLHIIRLGNINQIEKAKWQVIPLNIQFQIPSFHRTIATQDGNIYIVGGTKLQKVQKSNIIYQYDALNKTLMEVSHLQIGRSSHSILCYKKLIYIVGGTATNDQFLKKCQVFNPGLKQTKQFSQCKYPTTNSILCNIGDNLIKMGGVFASGQNNDHIQIYNITANFWGEVDPTIQGVKGQFGLLSCSGWSPLNSQQVFIFGGYNQENNNQNSKMSFVLQCNDDNQYTIKYVNLKNLPIAGGFWNQQSIVHRGTIYSLHNIDGQDGNQCVEDKRNLFIFNGKFWAICYPQ